jgi:hypothetical protein
LSASEQGRFASLVQAKFPSKKGEQIIRVSSSYNDVVSSLTFNDKGDQATFKFPVPLVTKASSGISIGFDQSRTIEDWPKTEDSRALGREKSAKTSDGAGASVLEQIAPYLRVGLPDQIIPSTAPASSALWGLMHTTTIRFSGSKQDKSPFKIVSVSAIRGTGSLEDRFLVRFNKPIKGFPESDVDPNVLKGSSYRFVLGQVTESKDERVFNDADPAKGGSSPGGTPRFGSDYSSLIIPMGTNVLGDNTRFKFYAEPIIVDVSGEALTLKDKTDTLSAGVFEERI